MLKKDNLTIGYHFLKHFVPSPENKTNKQKTIQQICTAYHHYFASWILPSWVQTLCEIGAEMLIIIFLFIPLSPYSHMRGLLRVIRNEYVIVTKKRKRMHFLNSFSVGCRQPRFKRTFSSRSKEVSLQIKKNIHMFNAVTNWISFYPYHHRLLYFVEQNETILVWWMAVDSHYISLWLK